MKAIIIAVGASLVIAASPATAGWVWVPDKTVCHVDDSTGTPLNVRSTPNGPILGALNNDTVVTVVETALSRGQKWVRIVPEIGTPGWVFHNYLDCGSPHADLPLVRPSQTRQTVLERISDGRWCASKKSYSLNYGGDNIIWTDNLGNVDVEDIVSNADDEAHTRTRRSGHWDNRNVPIGTMWSYWMTGRDQIQVGSSTGSQFHLTRC
jgi:hypothetical protein